MLGEVWITTDGRVYFVQLHEEDIIDYEPDLEVRDPDLEPVRRSLVSGRFKAHIFKVATSIVFKPHQRFGWQGTCIHGFLTPKWVQKQRCVEPAEDTTSQIYQEPRRATVVAINTKFSMFAIGTYGYLATFIINACH